MSDSVGGEAAGGGGGGGGRGGADTELKTKTPHVNVGKKVSLETQYRGFLAISRPLPARRQRFHFPQSLKFSTFKWENAEEKHVLKLNIEVFELFPGPSQ